MTLDIKRLRELRAAGTAGEWFFDGERASRVCVTIDNDSEHCGDGCDDDCDGMHTVIVADCEEDYERGTTDDAALIAAAVNALPELLDAAEERDALAHETAAAEARIAELEARAKAAEASRDKWRRLAGSCSQCSKAACLPVCAECAEGLFALAEAPAEPARGEKPR